MIRINVEPDEAAPPTDRACAIQTAAAWIAQKAMYLDTETTGLGRDAEVVDIAVVDWDGSVAFESLVHPTVPIPLKASKLHGIVDAMVAHSPRFDEVACRLANVLRDRLVVVYNAEFDRRMIEQSLDARGISFVPDNLVGLGRWVCGMELYAAFYGEWDTAHISYRWQRLGNAAQQCGIALPRTLHRARADAELTRLVVRHMAKGDQTWVAT